MAAIASSRSRRWTSSAIPPTWSWWAYSSAELASPTLLPHALADGAGNARWAHRRQHFRRLWQGPLQVRHFEHQLVADRFHELRTLARRHHERAGAADHAILVVVM